MTRPELIAALMRETGTATPGEMLNFINYSVSYDEHEERISDLETELANVSTPVLETALRAVQKQPISQ